MELQQVATGVLGGVPLGVGVVEDAWRLQPGGFFPRLCLYEKQFLTHASRIAAKASSVMPYLGRSLLIMGKNALMMYKVDATR